MRFTCLHLMKELMQAQWWIKIVLWDDYKLNLKHFPPMAQPHPRPAMGGGTTMGK